MGMDCQGGGEPHGQRNEFAPGNEGNIPGRRLSGAEALLGFSMY